MSVAKQNLEKLLGIYENVLKTCQIQINDPDLRSITIDQIWYVEEVRGLFHFMNNSQDYKQHFYLCGRIDEHRTNKYHAGILWYGINHISYALLSDCRSLITRYANLTFPAFPDLVEAGRATLSYALQCIMKEDWHELRRSLDIMDKKTLPSNKDLLPDRKFCEAMLNRDKKAVKKSIDQLLKDHRKRNISGVLSEIVSHPALGYAKLAWMKGMEIEIDHPLVPKEMLPFRPLEEYVDSHEFLNEI